MDTDEWTHNDWERVFHRARCNPVMFVEFFWNVAYPDKKVELTDAQKQTVFNKYKRIPFFEEDQSIQGHYDWIDQMRAKGYKDWEFWDNN